MTLERTFSQLREAARRRRAQEAPAQSRLVALRRARRALPSLASLRLASGLVLFAYAGMHLVNHGLGNISLEAMAEGARVKRIVWGNPVGTVALYGALLLHIALVLAKTIDRRSWRLPPWQVVQIATGLAVPALLLPHIAATRGTEMLLGQEVGYRQLLTLAWPNEIVRQTLLLAVVWIHGCVGLHFWWRLRPWYAKVAPYLGWAAVAVLVFAISGFVSASRLVIAEDLPRRFLPLPAVQAIGYWTAEIRLASLLFVAALGAYVALRPLLDRLQGQFRVTYRGERPMRASYGPTLLEISREAGLAHASACGGRARCSTCRVQVLSGQDLLDPPAPAEARLLERISAPPDVRLACQTRPRADIEVRMLVNAGEIYDPASASDPYRWGMERQVAVMFADLRGFTALTETRLAYDVVHFLNAYFDRVARAVEGHGGVVDKFMGDGMMALFSIDEPLPAGARKAVAAAAEMLAVIDALNAELEGELETPLRIAVGLHCGPAILGRIGGGLAAASAFTALGDTVNTAARLEGIAKAEDCPVCVSEALAEAAALGEGAGSRLTADIRGRRGDVPVRLYADAAALHAAMGRTVAAA